ncbi:MAG: hypothetical protein AAFU61_10420 [Pseudomonadota bacterium]
MSDAPVSRRHAALGVAAAALAGVAAAGPALADRPQMEKALEALETARTHLNKATSGQSGHKAKALEHVNAAINEVKAGMGA